MMTIRQFAAICGCTTQTLRYYDRIGLLTPAHVDPFSGYRHYEKEQAVDFVRIRSLQAADFAISEIRTLLKQTDGEVYAAFDRKIAQQLEKLEHIRSLQASYFTEKNAMEQLVHGITSLMMDQFDPDFDPSEFGLTPGDLPAVLSATQRYLDQMLPLNVPKDGDVLLTVNDETFTGTDAALEKIHSLDAIHRNDTILLSAPGVPSAEEGEWEILWERHGWQLTADVLPELPELESGAVYEFDVALADDRFEGSFTYPLLLLGLMSLRGNEHALMNCNIHDSKDGANHFLLKEKRA